MIKKVSFIVSDFASACPRQALVLVARASTLEAGLKSALRGNRQEITGSRPVGRIFFFEPREYASG